MVPLLLRQVLEVLSLVLQVLPILVTLLQIPRYFSVPLMQQIRYIFLLHPAR